MKPVRLIITLILMAASQAFAASVKPSSRPDSRPKREDLIPPPTDHPEAHQWQITTYVKGTPDEVRATLDKEVIEFAKKLGDARRELKNSQRKSEEQKRFLIDVLHESAGYRKLDSAVNDAKAALDKPAAAGASQSHAELIARYNKARAALDKLNASVDASASLVDLKKEETGLQEQITRFRAAAEKSLVWRAKLVEALVTTVTVTGPIKAGESNGILGDVTVQDVEDDAALVQFDLYENKRAVKSAEGMVSVVRAGRRVPVLIRGLGDRLERLRPGDTLHLFTVYSVTAIRPVKPAGSVYIVEPMASDLDYLLEEIRTPPDIDKISEAAGAATTDPADESPDAK